MTRLDLGPHLAIAAAVRTGLLAAIAAGPVDEAALIQRLGLAPRGAHLLIDVLVACELVERGPEGVGPGAELRRAADAPGGPALLFGMWGHLEDFVRTGEPYVAMDQGAADRERAYTPVVSGLARVFERDAAELASVLPVHPRRVLDVGCGSGVWSLAVAERDRDVHVTGQDLPSVLDNFRSRATALGLSDRTDTIAGDMHDVALGGGFDLAIIANVLRLEPPARAAALVARVASALAPGGALLVVDALGESAVALATYALHLALRTRSGEVHAPSTITGWLVGAGLPHVQPLPLRGSQGPVGALLATKEMP